MYKSLHTAKKNKNDEFYTDIKEIEKEIPHYKEAFKNKIVYCNCDDPAWSAFWEYFHKNFSKLGLKKLISTHYTPKIQSYIMEYSGGDDNNILVGKKTPLEGNGDFASDECIEILKQSDIIVTNPPFSLMREFIPIVMKYNKKLLIIAPITSVIYKSVFLHFKNNQLRVGVNNTGMRFRVPNDADFSKCKNCVVEKGIKWCKLGNVVWITNLSKEYNTLSLRKLYNAFDYPKYEKYDAINIDKVKDIPKDYEGLMGVPITYMLKHNPEQFNIIDVMHDGRVNGRELFKRIIIQKK